MSGINSIKEIDWNDSVRFADLQPSWIEVAANAKKVALAVFALGVGAAGASGAAIGVSLAAGSFLVTPLGIVALGTCAYLLFLIAVITFKMEYWSDPEYRIQQGKEVEVLFKENHWTYRDLIREKGHEIEKYGILQPADIEKLLEPDLNRLSYKEFEGRHGDCLHLPSVRRKWVDYLKTEHRPYIFTNSIKNLTGSELKEVLQARINGKTYSQIFIELKSEFTHLLRLNILSQEIVRNELLADMENSSFADIVNKYTWDVFSVGIFTSDDLKLFEGKFNREWETVKVHPVLRYQQVGLVHLLKLNWLVAKFEDKPLRDYLGNWNYTNHVSPDLFENLREKFGFDWMDRLKSRLEVRNNCLQDISQINFETIIFRYSYEILKSPVLNAEALSIIKEKFNQIVIKEPLKQFGDEGCWYLLRAKFMTPDQIYPGFCNNFDKIPGLNAFKKYVFFKTGTYQDQDFDHNGIIRAEVYRNNDAKYFRQLGVI